MDMQDSPTFDPKLWFTMEPHCQGKHYILYNSHTFRGRFSAWCPVKHRAVNVSKSDIAECSEETRYWLKGFLCGNEPDPPRNDEGVYLSPQEVAFKGWQQAVDLFAETGYWNDSDWKCAVCGAALPPSTAATKCDHCRAPEEGTGSNSQQPLKPLPPRLEDVPPENLISVGGPVQDSTVSLRVFGDTLDPAEITRLLGCQPTGARKKGDVIPDQRYHRHAQTGSWLLKSALAPTTDLAKQIEALLDLLTTDLEVWRRITSSYEVDLFCGIFLDERNRGIAVPSSLIARLSERGLELGFDIYYYEASE